MKFAKILKIANAYSVYLKKDADLETDMAKRIMLSVIPSLTSPGINYQTGGLPDYNALKLAVKGAERIIKFGTKACVDEMGFYGAEHRGTEKFDTCKDVSIAAEKAYNSKNYIESLRLCFIAFEDLSSWETYFGGKKWARIAKTIMSITTTYDQLNIVRKAGRAPGAPTNNLNQELELMRSIVVEMNVFDGLVHNGGSILDKMIYLEDAEEQETRRRVRPDDTSDNDFVPHEESKYYRIKNLMDAKELKNPIDVYKQIENSLQNSEERYMFKDWVSKLRNHSDYQNYYQRESEVRSEIQNIRAKKTLIEMTERATNCAESLLEFKGKVGGLSKIAIGKRTELTDFVINIKLGSEQIKKNMQDSEFVSGQLKLDIFNLNSKIHNYANILMTTIFGSGSKIDPKIITEIDLLTTAWKGVVSLVHSI